MEIVGLVIVLIVLDILLPPLNPPAPRDRLTAREWLCL